MSKTVQRRGLVARSEELARLYEEIYQCDACVGAPGCHIEHDPQRVHRVFVPRALQSEVFLVGEALGGKTQRKSGVPYCLPNGSLSQAGRKLDAFLEPLGYTIHPSDERRSYVYSSDVIQRYPGPAKRGGGDREPTKSERNNCADWLKQELLLVRPKVVLLLGKVAAKDFLERYAGIGVWDMDRIWGERYECAVDGFHVSALPIRHFAYRFDREATERTRLTAQDLMRTLLHD